MQWSLQGDDRRFEQHHRAGWRTQPAVGMGYALPMQLLAGATRSAASNRNSLHELRPIDASTGGSRPAMPRACMCIYVLARAPAGLLS